MTDVLTMGEALLRLSVEAGASLETAPQYLVHGAGAEANVASTLARLDREVVWVSRLPEGPLGRRILNQLRGDGVDCSHVVWSSGERLGAYYVQLMPDPLPAAVIYDRVGSAAASLSPEDIPWEVVDDARIVSLSGITPALSQSCLESSNELATRAKSGDPLFVFDINYRPKLWSPESAAVTLEQLAREADMVVCTREDAADLFGVYGEPADVVASLAGRFEASRMIVTSGSEGAWWWEGGTIGHVPSIAVTVVDRIGAGDAFTAGVLDGLLDGNLEEGVWRGTALAALALTTRGDTPVADRARVEALLHGDGRSVDR